MASQSERLPRRFPIGTKFVVEDKGFGDNHIYSRYLVFPDGRCVDLPSRSPAPPARSVERRRRQRRH